MENSYPGGIVPLASDLSYLNGGRFGVGYGQFANDSSVQHGIHYNRQHSENQADCTRNVLSSEMSSVAQNLENLTRDNQFDRICDRLNQLENRTGDKIVETERRTDDQIMAIREQNHAAEVRSVEQFCTLQAQNSSLEATLAANKEIAELRQQLTVEQTLNRQYCCPPPCKPVDPCCGGSNNGGGGDIASAVVNALAPALNSIASAVAGLSNGPGNSGNN